MTFTASGAIDDISKKEVEQLRPILHLAGDAVALASNIKSEKTRKKVINTFNSIIDITRQQLDGGLSFILEQEIKNAELVGKFSYEKVFGENIRDILWSLCTTPEAKQIYLEAFPEEQEMTLDNIDDMFPEDGEGEDLDEHA